MCRNIRTLYNFEPPATQDEINAAALQFVRKLSGFNKPSRVNEAVFNAAINEISQIAGRMLSQLETKAPAKYREVEKARAQARNRERFG